jgi:hypothetical protein
MKVSEGLSIKRAVEPVDDRSTSHVLPHQMYYAGVFTYRVHVSHDHLFPREPVGDWIPGPHGFERFSLIGVHEFFIEICKTFLDRLRLDFLLSSVQGLASLAKESKDIIASERFNSTRKAAKTHHHEEA